MIPCNYVSVGMFLCLFRCFSHSSRQEDRASTYNRVIIKEGWEKYVHLPTIVPKSDFSFVASSVIFGKEAIFSVGHGILPKDAAFTLTFDHQIDAHGATCNDGNNVVLQCNLSEDKLLLACTKQDAASMNPCNLGITFKPDITRLITVKASFTGLPDGIIFHPTFTILAEPDGPSVAPVGPLYFGQEMTLAYTLPRALRRTDKLSVSMQQRYSCGDLKFVRFEPSIQPRSSLAVVNVSQDYLHIDIPLDLLDEGKVTPDNFKLIFRHIPPMNHERPLSTKYAFQTKVNDYDAVPDTSLLLMESSVRITRVPSALSTLYSIVGLDHPDMAAGDSFLLNDLTYTADALPELRCDGLVTPIVAVNNLFTLTAAVPAAHPCYVVLPSYAMSLDYWSLTATIAGVSSTVFSRASYTRSIKPYITGHGFLYKDNIAEEILNIPDFTTELAPGSSRSISFGYTPAEVEFHSISCQSPAGETDAVTYIDSLKGEINIKFLASSVPFAKYGELKCIMTITPLAVVEFPKITDVKILDRSFGDMAFSAFNAPRITLTLPTSPVTQGVFDYYNTNFRFEGLTPVIGDKITLTTDRSDIPPSAIYLQCKGVFYENGIITIKEIIGGYEYLCNYKALYLSDKAIRVTATYIADEMFTAEAFAPPSRKRNSASQLKPSNKRVIKSPIMRASPRKELP